ncbi:MAG: transporter [Acidobacteriaceae bacterium]
MAGAQNTFVNRWLDNVTRIQNEEPRWISPLVMTTPRLEQKLREDIARHQISGGHVWIFDDGKGLELIPVNHVAVTFNLPPYMNYDAPHTKDGFGDVSFLLKYRVLARNATKGDYIVSVFLGGSIPTGSYNNGKNSATVTPTLAGGKGWGRFNLEGSLGAALPVDSVDSVSRCITWNTVAEYKLYRYFWTEVESNASFNKGGSNDGKTQEFITPGFQIGRIRPRKRTGLTFGTGMQIATSHYHSYNHALMLSSRFSF